VSVGAGWARRNLGLEYPRERGDERVPASAAGARAADDRELARELIEFDSEAPEGEAFRALATAAPGGLGEFVEIKWPKGLEPRPGRRPTGSSLPRADLLIVTWTTDEGHALARVLTPGHDSHQKPDALDPANWRPYRKNYTQIAALMRAGCPAREYGWLGTYWTTQIGTNTCVLFKSDSHMSQDGPKLPNALVWRQLIEDVRPRWVITTGTGGGIGSQFEVGDVIVSRFVGFDCSRGFKKLNKLSYASPTEPPAARLKKAQALFRFNAQFLPRDNKRPPQIIHSTDAASGVLTTDFFGFDTSDNRFGLQGKGDLSEMGDAVLGMVCQELGSKAPSYTIVRNVSDPEINATGLTFAQQRAMAADIYKAYGRWSSVCSAITCWAIAAAA